MIKILHTADWHLGKKLGPYSRYDEQVQVMDEICKITVEQDIDIVLIAGDCFDQINPDTASIQLFYQTLHKLSRGGRTTVVAIAGNHDSPERIDAPTPLALPNNIFLIGEFEKQVNGAAEPGVLSVQKSVKNSVKSSVKNMAWPCNVEIIATPYVNDIRLKKIIDKQDGGRGFRKEMSEYWLHKHRDSDKSKPSFCILLTHLLFMDEGSSVNDDDEKPIIFTGGTEPLFAKDVPSEIDLVALGHLHRNHWVGEKRIRYAGSPLCYSFSEAGQKKYVNVITINGPISHSIAQIELTSGRPLLKKRCSSVNEACNWLQDNQHAFVELTLDMDRFLTAEEQQALANAHDRCQLVPNFNIHEEGHVENVDITQSMEDLFKDYVKQTKYLDASDELLDMFQEVLAKKGNHDS